MVWFRVDDGFPKSRKVLSIPKRRRAAAAGVWLLAGAWSAGELTDGFIPRYALDEIPNGPQSAPDLVAAGLWNVVSRGSRVMPDGSPTDARPLFDGTPNDSRLIPDDGWVFRNWSGYQPSKDDVERERSDSAARQKAYRDRKRVERDGKRDALVTHNASRNGDVTATAPRPDPTRPVVPTELQEQPPPSEVAPRNARATRLPEDWEPNPELIRWVQENCPGIDGRIQTMKFRNYWISKSGKDATKMDWDRTYQNWMIESAERIPAETAGGPSTGTQRAMAAVNAARQITEARNQQTQIGAS